MNGTAIGNRGWVGTALRAPQRRFQSGITAMEILIALGLLVVLLSFASPSLSGATARAEFKAATENVDLSIRMARSASRQLGTSVILQVDEDPHSHLYFITFTMPQQPESAVVSAGLMDYQFPESVRVSESPLRIRFDERGLVDPSINLELVSLLDDELSHRMVVD